MAATVLNSPRAIAMSLYVIRAFLKKREQLAANAAILKRLPDRNLRVKIDREVTQTADEHKRIADEIDILLGQHYGFTAEELDFIINYDIKYRLGRETDADEQVGS